MAVRFVRLEQVQALAEKLVEQLSGLATRVQTLEATGGQANLIERIFLNEVLCVPDKNKDVRLTVPTKVTELENDASYQENVIEAVTRNGVPLSVADGKTVNIPVPTALSELNNDMDFQNGDEVTASIQTAIAKSGHASFVKADAVPAADKAQENILYLVINSDTGHYDIYAKVGDSVELLDDTTVDLTNYVQKPELEGYVAKEEGKALSANDFTDALKEKLDGVEENANNYTLDKAKVIEALGYTPGNAEKMTVLWGNVLEKPETFPPSEHSHTKSEITDFPTLGDAAAKAVRTLQAQGASGWTNYDTEKQYVPDLAFMAYWNGAYSGTASNLAYCNQGAFASMIKVAARRNHNTSGTWIPVWSNDNLDYILKSELNVNYANGAGNANGFTFGAQTSDPGANSSLTTNKVLFVYE